MGSAKIELINGQEKKKSPVNRVIRICTTWLERWNLSLFEKVIIVNSVLLILDALVGLWITSHSLESHHYFIDTTFIVVAALLTLLINILLLRLSFRPLFGLLTTIRAISAGKTETRATLPSLDTEIGELSRAFNTMLDRLEEQRREQAGLILQAQEEERRRIALELHDEAGQNLTALLVHTEILSQQLQTMPVATISQEARHQLQSGLQQLSQLTQHTLENVRVLAQQLRPSVLDDLGLVAALRWLVEDSRERLHLEVDLDMSDTEPLLHQLPGDCETALFRITQEGLTNIARHAQTRHASILITRRQKQLCLQIQDHGRGYQVEQAVTGLGIFGMCERAELVGGTLKISSQPGDGTTIEALLPAQERTHPDQEQAEEKHHVY